MMTITMIGTIGGITMIEKLKIIAELIFIPLLIGIVGMTGVMLLLVFLAQIFTSV